MASRTHHRIVVYSIMTSVHQWLQIRIALGLALASVFATNPAIPDMELEDNRGSGVTSQYCWAPYPLFAHHTHA